MVSGQQRKRMWGRDDGATEQTGAVEEGKRSTGILDMFQK